MLNTAGKIRYFISSDFRATLSLRRIFSYGFHELWNRYFALRKWEVRYLIWQMVVCVLWAVGDSIGTDLLFSLDTKRYKLWICSVSPSGKKWRIPLLYLTNISIQKCWIKCDIPSRLAIGNGAWKAGFRINYKNAKNSIAYGEWSRFGFEYKIQKLLLHKSGSILRSDLSCFF